jgi:hypothetical protein
LNQGQAEGLAGAGAPAAFIKDLRHLTFAVLGEQAVHFVNEGRVSLARDRH